MKPPTAARVRPIHPALHFDGDQAHIGILDAAGAPWVVSSDRQKRCAETLAEQGRLLSAPTRYSPLADQWPEEDLARFLAGDSAPMLGPVLTTIAALIDHYYELADLRHAKLVAAWIIGSYLFPLFTTFPRLHFQGAEGSGKSKLLQLISLFAFNTTVREILAHRPRSVNREALVFPNGAAMVDLRWAEKDFPRAVEAAGIEDFRLHDLRHTFASRLVMAGVDLLTVMQLGGWKSLAMVQRYGHLSPGHRQSAVERLVSRLATAEAGGGTRHGVAP